ncbi:MAG TPA: DUF4136 domain-containing protein [Dongiaceae bacterium]|nr:DUF4136 domain-containing protein [Dongiaceae bacterium]
MRLGLPALSVFVLGSLVAAPIVAPPAFAQSVKADYDKKTDFTQYKSFVFKPGTDAPTPFAQERIVAAIGDQLKLRGMTAGAGTADLEVFTHVKLSTEKRMDVTSFGYGGYAGWGGWGGGFGTSSVMVTDIPMGTLMVDLVDTKTNQLVWRGIASDTLSTNPTPEKSEKRINKAVSKLFYKYPVPPAKKK